MADNGNFTVLGESDKPFSPADKTVVDLLEGILSAEKGQAVPRVLFWEIDPTTGKAMRANQDGSPRAPLSLQLAEPPKFGASVTDKEFRFRERPPVSLERVSVKSRNPRGLLSYEEIEIAFTVHRPDVVFEDIDQTDHDAWASLIVPGRAHAMEYGWSASTGVKNGLLNGEGVDAGNGVVIPGKRQIRFSIVTYDFAVLGDNQIRFNVKGIELGEFNLRQAFLTPQADQQQTGGSPADTQSAKAAARIKSEKDPYSSDRAELNRLLKKVQDKVADKQNAPKGQKPGGKSVQFGKLLEFVFVPRIRDAFTEMGMEVKNIFVGRFNERAGKPTRKYGNTDMAGRPISEFTFPLDEVQQVFTDLMNLGERLTVVNFISPFLRLFEDPTRWDRGDEQDKFAHTVPQVAMRSAFRRLNNGKIEVTFYIFDTNREYTRFAPSDKDKLKPGHYTKSDVRQAVLDAGVPFVSLVKANSFVKEPAFQVVMDEQMKSIFMRRYATQSRSREQVTSQPDVVAKQLTPPPDPRQLFSASIQGDLVILGNFVFDVFMLIWIDFGVPFWDGPFNVLEKEDIIEPGEFTTRLKVVSAGTDPLGTQGRPNPTTSP